MIEKIKTIKALAVFKNFNWDTSFKDENNEAKKFKEINILYGRNYSGKTTLSRILQAMETENLSDKYEDPEFCILFKDGSKVTQDNFRDNNKNIRVFNEDFVKRNLRFISNPEEDIESFAILGEDNNKIEREITELKNELGSNEESKETGLFANLKQIKQSCKEKQDYFDIADGELDELLSKKAIDKKKGIKYDSNKYGDQNYNISKLDQDIQKVLDPNFRPLTNEQKLKEENLINENIKDAISFNPLALNFNKHSEEVKELVTKKIPVTNKIAELVRNADLNQWVYKGQKLHENSRGSCAFCANHISQDRWIELEKHFDQESKILKDKLENSIQQIKKEQERFASCFAIDKKIFYSQFEGELGVLSKEYESASSQYAENLASLLNQLQTRKKDIMNYKEFIPKEDNTSTLNDIWNRYQEILTASNQFTAQLASKKLQAKKMLRLREVSDFVSTSNYVNQKRVIDNLQTEIKEKSLAMDKAEVNIAEKKKLIYNKEQDLNDEEKGAKKVNEYLNNILGHPFISLEAKTLNEINDKKVKFEVIRDGRRAYHLSQGECNLLAFCYFLARLEDIYTKSTKPILWIDDPVSSLDGNHIFFIFSLIKSEIILKKQFEQIFISTHSLEFLRFLKRISERSLKNNNQDYGIMFFIVQREGETATINLMPEYMKKYITEFNYLFQQIYNCARMDEPNDANYQQYYNFGNNARKFLEIYLYYKYPDASEERHKLKQFFEPESIPSIFINRINNELSHAPAKFERGAMSIESEIKSAAKLIIKKIKEDEKQYHAFLKSIGEPIKDAI